MQINIVVIYITFTFVILHLNGSSLNTNGFMLVEDSFNVDKKQLYFRFKQLYRRLRWLYMFVLVKNSFILDYNIGYSLI